MNDCDRGCEFCKGSFSLSISGVDLLMKNISKVFTNLDDKLDFIELKMCFEIDDVSLVQIVLVCQTLVAKHCLKTGLTI